MEQERKPSRREEPRKAPARRKRKGGLTSVGLYVIFVIGISVLLATVGWVCANDVLALKKPQHSAVITVTDTDSFADVTADLKENGIIEYQWLFSLFSSVTQAKGKVTAGAYELSSDMDYRAIITNLSAASAARKATTVTIPEGLTLLQTFQLLEEKGVSTVAKLTETAANHDYKFSFLKDLPLGEATRLEGYLFPDTYQFYQGENPLYAINKMLVNFDAKLTEKMREQIADSGKTVHEILIVAAMIEKETDSTDQTTISSVIYNRLKNLTGGTNGYLQIDATVQYALPARKEQLSTEDTQIDSPYNTYKYPGLPAGPIANPGIAAIRAAINPKDTNYYYYVLGSDSVHHFFRSYNEQLNYIASMKSNG